MSLTFRSKGSTTIKHTVVNNSLKRHSRSITTYRFIEDKIILPVVWEFPFLGTRKVKLFYLRYILVHRIIILKLQSLISSFTLILSSFRLNWFLVTQLFTDQMWSKRSKLYTVFYITIVLNDHDFNSFCLLLYDNFIHFHDEKSIVCNFIYFVFSLLFTEGIKTYSPPS